MNNLDQLRERFEAFVKSEYDHASNLKTEYYDIVIYKDDEVECMWMAWQHQQKRIDELEERLAIAVEALELVKESFSEGWSQIYANEALNKIRKIGE